MVNNLILIKMAKFSTIELVTPLKLDFVTRIKNK